MKSLIMTIATIASFFVLQPLQINAAPTQNQGQFDAWEYNALKNECRNFIYNVEEHLAGRGGAHGGGALTGSAVQHAFKPEISSYLLSRGTPAARKIYAEYEAIGWKYPDIKNI